MNQHRFASLISSTLVSRLMAVCFLSLGCALTAHAQAQRTFVSTSGSDANTASLCSTANPCRSFAAALTVTTAGGEIIALTSGGYGAVEITKAVQITAPTGVYVAITALPATAIGGTDAIRVNAGSTDIVVLRGLTLNNVGVANANGITFPAGFRLYVENCVINGFDNHGISVDRSVAASPELFVTDTIIRNGDSISITDAGIFLRQTAGGLIRTTINNCLLERAGFVGLLATDRTLTTVRNTVVARNFGFGFVVAATTGTTANLNLENSTATLNTGDGIFAGDFSTFAGGAATARISSTTSGNNSGDGIEINTNGTAHISDSTFNGNADDGVDVSANAIAHISTSTINDNGSDGIDLANNATSRVFVTFTTISGNTSKGLNRNANGTATSIGSNRIFNNTGGSDAFSATIAQQ